MESKERPTGIEGKVVLVTGGGQGLGAAICETLYAAGAVVIPADIQLEKALAIASSLPNANGRVMCAQLDVSDSQGITGVIEQVMQRYGRIDVLVNNAGTDKTVPIEELAVEEWERIIAVNLTGPFLMSKAVLPIMKQQGQGYIINIVSTAAKRAWPNAAAYHASKWGLLGFSHALHTEARPHNIKVTALISGGMRTPFLLDRFPDIDPQVLQDPHNVAESVAFLLTTPAETVIPELMVIPMRETSWP